jgi:autotransporter-associated beta strand protein
MKPFFSNPAFNPAFNPALFLTFLILAAIPVASAQGVLPNEENFTSDYDFNGTGRLASSQAVIWGIGDDCTVTVRNFNTTGDGGVFSLSGAATLSILPSGTLGAGYVVFQSNTATGGGGVFTTNLALSAANVLFQDNHAGGNGGVFTGGGAVTVASGTIMGNHATGNGGVLNNTSNSTKTFTGVAFLNNRAGNTGGVFRTNSGQHATLEIIDAPAISGNLARNEGGVFETINTTGYATIIRLTGSTTQSDFVYSGNMAFGNPSTLSAADVVAGATDAHAANPLKGGFYMAAPASGQNLLQFDIAAGVSLTLGSAANVNADSIATQGQLNANSGTNALIQKLGGGRLVLHADSAWFKGAIQVQSGTLLLGNDNARLGGLIDVSAGATLGGVGTFATGTGATLAGAVITGHTLVTINAGATLRAGMDTADTPGTLAVSGTVTLKDGAILHHDLFTGNAAGMIHAGFLNQEAGAIIDIGRNETDDFVLAEWTSGNVNASNLTLTVNGAAPTARGNGSLSVSGNQLRLASQVSSLVMSWTAQAGEWTARDGGQNWDDGGPVSEKVFRNGDTAVFAGDASGQPRQVAIAGAGVIVSDMLATGGADYLFTGSGGITADAASAEGAAITGSGMLRKSGTGTLTFANTGANFFQNGIALSGGVLGFERASQIQTGAAGIVFNDSGTLRAAPTVSGMLTPALTVAAGVVAAIEVAAQGRLVYGGTLSGGADSVLRKTGSGALVFQGDNGANTVAARVDEGALLAGASSSLGGNLSVGTGAMLGGDGELGAGGGVTLAAGAVLAAGMDSSRSGTLTVHNLNVTGGAVFQFDLYNDMDGAVKRSDRIHEAGVAQISGINIIDLTTGASGTFNLGNLTGLASGCQVTLNSQVLPNEGRQSAALSDGGGWLRLVTIMDKSRLITWTGGSNTSWGITAKNWAGLENTTQYNYGDHVVFDGLADATNPGNRVITIDGSQVSVSDMTVTGGADYTFAGDGGISVRMDSVIDNGTPAEITAARGRLVKNGGGTLTFANNAANFFEGGIEIGGGAIVFNRGDHLATSGTTGIAFTGDAALRAGAGGVELSSAIAIDAGVTAGFDSDNHVVTLSGPLTGGAGATFAKTGAGVLILQADSAAFSGVIAVRDGVLRVGATDMLTASGASAIVVDAGATLDLDGHNQTLSNLSGAGAVALGEAQLTMIVDTGTRQFAGGFEGAGIVIKQGAGKWLLSGSSAHTGGVLLDEGVIGLAGSHALGAGVLTVNAAAALISADAAGLLIPNDIVASAATATLSLSSDAGQSEFSGKITAHDTAVAIEGSGTLVLSGNNNYASLDVRAPRLVARRAESVSGGATIGANSVLEFRDIASGQAQGAFTGGAIWFTSSTLLVSGSNRLRNFVVSARSDITAASPHALGGPLADVAVRDSGALRLTGTAPLLGHNLTVADGGALIFGVADPSKKSASYDGAGIGALALSGSLRFENNSEVRLGARVPAGIYAAATAGGGINAPAYDPNQDNGMFMVVDVVDAGSAGQSLLITAYNKALEPGKDITVAFDAMLASLRSVHGHIGDEFITPLMDRKPGAGRRGLWFRALGTFAEHGGDSEHLGYTDTTYAGLLGCDWLAGENVLLGGWLGCSGSRIETDNDASTDLRMPSLGAYAIGRLGKTYLMADAGFGTGGADTRRVEDFGNTVTGDYKLTGMSGGIEAGGMLRPFARGMLRPSIGLRCMHLDFRNYRETGAGAMRADSFSATAWQVLAGCEVGGEVRLPWGQPGLVKIRAGWRENLSSRVSEVRASLVAHPGARLPIRGDSYDASGVTGGLGVHMLLSRNTLFALAYDFDYTPAGDYDSDTIRHTFNAALRLSW